MCTFTLQGRQVNARWNVRYTHLGYLVVVDTLYFSNNDIITRNFAVTETFLMTMLIT